jgi:hypothetical protein
MHHFAGANDIDNAGQVDIQYLRLKTELELFIPHLE